MASVETYALDRILTELRAHPRGTATLRRLRRTWPVQYDAASKIVGAERAAAPLPRWPSEKRSPTDREWALIDALGSISLRPVSADRRLIGDLLAAGRSKALITERQATVINAAGHTYRRQLGRCMADGCGKCGGSA